MVNFTLMMHIEWINAPDSWKAAEQAVNDTYRPRIKEMVLDRFQRTVTVRGLSAIHQTQSSTIVPQQEFSQKSARPSTKIHLRGHSNARINNHPTASYIVLYYYALL